MSEEKPWRRVFEDERWSESDALWPGYRFRTETMPDGTPGITIEVPGGEHRLVSLRDVHEDATDPDIAMAWRAFCASYPMLVAGLYGVARDGTMPVPAGGPDDWFAKRRQES